MRASVEANTITVNIPNTADDLHRQELEQRWVFQKLSDLLQEFETQVSTIVDNNRLWLTISYFMLFAISIARIVIYFYTAKIYADTILSSDKTMLLIESCLSVIWVMYSFNLYLSKMRLAYVENVRWTSLMYVIFCVQYFSVSYWVIEIVFNAFPRSYGITVILLYIAYGFMAEKSPNLLAVTVYLILMFFLLECIIRLLICKCYNPWNANDFPQFTSKSIDVHCYKDEKYTQKTCGICLRDFVKEDKICELSCHEAHIFHSACLEQWLNRNRFCPYCRHSITGNN